MLQLMLMVQFTSIVVLAMEFRGNPCGGSH